MSDKIKDYIGECGYDGDDACPRDNLFAALDAERAEHGKELDELNKDLASRCECRFDPGVQDPATVCAYHSCPPLSHTKQVADLKKRIVRLEAQLLARGLDQGILFHGHPRRGSRK